MHGYVDMSQLRIFNSWYFLFKQRHGTLSLKEYEYWKKIIALGLKSCKNNYFKNFSFEEFCKYDFSFQENTKLNISKIKKLSLSINCNRLVFINGQFISELSDINIDPWILTINKKKPDCKKKPNCIQSAMFLFLTECLSDYIINIKLPMRSITKKPLYLLHISEGSNIYNKLFTSHYYYNIETEQDTESSIIEHFVSMNHQGHFVGDYIILSAGERSKLNHIKLIFENRSSYHISHQNINLKKSSTIKSNIFIINGPKFTYHQINSQINHENTSLKLNSLVYLLNKDISNIKTHLEHNNKNYSVSKQLHKIIAHDHSTGIFDGLIKVNQNSIKTDGKMINNNLLLNRLASIYSTPKLEIYSDAVQCSHGATIGEINLEHLFYLNARGISQQDALIMLIDAFAIEIIEKIKSPLLQKILLHRINLSLSRIIAL